MPNSTHNPEVSVIIATYNEPAEILRKSIQSILDQTLTNIEVLVFDDSTSDETRSILDSFSEDTRLRIIRSNKRIGFVLSLNLGLQQARGNFIARMDGDDVSLPNRLEIQTTFLKQHPSISVVGGSIYIIDEKGVILSKRKYPTFGFLLNLFSIYRNPLAHPTVIFRRECIEKGFFYDPSYKKAEDLELWLRLKKNGFRIANVSDFVLKYRVIGDLSKKRTKENWEYNLKARIQNFSFHNPFSGILGILFSYIYTKLPGHIIRKSYSIENNNRF